MGHYERQLDLAADGSKLRVKSEEEVQMREMLIEGVLALQAGENPRIVREKLSAFLPPNKRSSDEESK